MTENWLYFMSFTKFFWFLFISFHVFHSFDVWDTKIIFFLSSFTHVHYIRFIFHKRASSLFFLEARDFSGKNEAQVNWCHDLYLSAWECVECTRGYLSAIRKRFRSRNHSTLKSGSIAKVSAWHASLAYANFVKAYDFKNIRVSTHKWRKQSLKITA